MLAHGIPGVAMTHTHTHTHTKHHLCERALRLNAKLNEVYRISVYTLWSLSKVS